MNRTKSIALFAGIFAIAMTTYGLSGVSSSPMAMASIPQSQEGMKMLGHFEYTAYDSENNVKAYLQTDNVVVNDGTDCAGAILFATTTDGDCGNTAAFTWIGIGNGTAGAGADDVELDADTPGTCASSGVDGEMARKNVVPDVTVTNVGAGTQVELDVGSDTFKFSSSNATTVTQSAIFNGNTSAQTANGECATMGTVGTQFEMFAIQDLSGGGVTVSDGDSLAVKWTITIS
ncbi:hypothetical protein [Nitrosopumilus sp.]|uniref:hypothetical protein n=1 Tax=Nitrosopumilus sp. TaxID=2024843 RepID=UPI00247DDEB8|nr:hypothetical protein [Nitrosopumilus sp.]MCV0430686.1 hypothetical protein [Nitrosopumilus sp.]